VKNHVEEQVCEIVRQMLGRDSYMKKLLFHLLLNCKTTRMTCSIPTEIMALLIGPSLEKPLRVDAICINQKDLEEQPSQALSTRYLASSECRVCISLARTISRYR